MACNFYSSLVDELSLYVCVCDSLFLRNVPAYSQSEIYLGLMGDNGRIRVASPPESSLALWRRYVAFGDDNQGGYLGGQF